MEKNQERSDDSSYYYGSIKRWEYKLMKRVMESTQGLIFEIMNSDIYKEFLEVTQKVKADKTLWERLNQYRKRRFQMQLENNADLTQLQNRLRMEFDDIQNNQLALEFLIAERRYCNLMKQVNHTILDGAGMEIEFLED